MRFITSLHTTSITISTLITVISLSAHYIEEFHHAFDIIALQRRIWCIDGILLGKLGSLGLWNGVCPFRECSHPFVLTPLEILLENAENVVDIMFQTTTIPLNQ